MTYFVGLDVSQKITAICVVDDTGRRLWRGQCPTNPEQISILVRRHAGDDARIGIETGAMTPWLVHELRNLGLEVVCLDARHARAALKMQNNKTDQERLHEEFKRRIKTQTVLPSAETAAMLFWALLASGQIVMRKVDGWQSLAEKPSDQIIDLAA